jgi:spermidine synthase
VPSISKNSNGPLYLIFCAGLLSAAVQTVFFREFLSVFSGNELSIGIILGVWLLSTGAGTMVAFHRASATSSRGSAGQDAALAQRDFGALPPLLTLFAVFGLFCIRSSRLAAAPGASMSPLSMFLVCTAGEAPYAIVNGYLLGVLFAMSRSSNKLYGWENSGAGAGALCAFACVLLSCHNTFIVAFSLFPLVGVPFARRRLCAAITCCILALFAFDRPTLQWKYAEPLRRLTNGREAEIAVVATGTDSAVLVNGALYTSTMDRPFSEQAVHIPMAQRPNAVSALVIYDRGHHSELSKYKGLFVDIIETEPALASPGSRLAAPELFRPHRRYDMIFLGSGMPRTAAANRFYTQSFFRRMKSLLSDSGVLTFSLMFSENYKSRTEQQLYDAVYSTLKSSFGVVLVFPGNGCTFMASDAPLRQAWESRVPTDYLASSIVPGTSQERIDMANKPPRVPRINSRDRPIALLLSLETWLESFRGQSALLCALLALLFFAAIVFLPKTAETLSVGTSGIVIGMYSVCILLLYQSTFGALYSRVSLLLLTLTAGFAAGTQIKRFAFSDAAIGLYAVLTLLFLARFPGAPAILFYLCHAGIGLLGAAQFVSRKNTSSTALYAADLLGGALGMALCSTLLVPLFGILPVACGLLLLKGSVEAAIRVLPSSSRSRCGTAETPL